MLFKQKKLNRHVSVAFLLIPVLLILSMVSCSFMDSLGSEDSKVQINSLNFGKQAMTMKVGSMDYIPINVKPTSEQKNISLGWNYNQDIIECNVSSNWGVTIKALKEGQTALRCSYGGYDATCMITVSGFEQNYESTTEPYIYSNTSILQVAPGVSERVYVSLYGGDARDIDGYTWTIDSPSIASINPIGQYCMITAKDSGYARIKVTHSKAVYPYYIGVYVFADATNVTYITTPNNILTMNKDTAEQTISVSLVNGKETSMDSSFIWQIVNSDSSTPPVKIQYNGNRAVVTPVENGSCTLRVTHPDAAYPLDILCRVITVVKNVYIQPDNTIVYLNGDEQQSITSTLENINISEYSIDEYEYRLDNYSAASIVSSVGNQVIVKGKANGSSKLIISHPKAAYAREVLLIVTGQLTDAIDASLYITTSQNYVRTKVGGDEIPLSISLKGGVEGDERDFIWSVKSNAADGTNADVINLETPTGTVNYARMLSSTYAYGNAAITPLVEGTAIITVSHPKIVYPTEILVKVLNKNAILEEPLYIAGEGLIKILNGETDNYTVELKGENKKTSDENLLEWSVNNNAVKIVANGNEAEITAPAKGSSKTVSKITVEHPKADSPKNVLLLTADTKEELDSMKAFYSDKQYYNISVGDISYLNFNAVGFEPKLDEEGNVITPSDLLSSTIKWEVENPDVVSIESSYENFMCCSVKGLKAGKSNVTAIYKNDTSIKISFVVTVYPAGYINTAPEVYFTTSQNVICLGGAGKQTTVNINAVNLSSSEYRNITWECSDSSVVTVQSNGTRANFYAKKDGEAVVSVKHPESQNTLKIYVRCGKEYVIPEAEPLVYISAQDVITMLKDAPATQLKAILVNYDGADTNGFRFSIDNEEIAEITTQSINGTAYIKPVCSGQAEITITHPKTEITKKVLVVVGNSEEELAGFTYLTTANNVVAVGEGSTKNVSVTVKNATNVVLDGYTWTSSNPSCVDVIQSGSTAIFKGNKIGTSIIKVRNSCCLYPLEIIAQCVDPIAAAANPYIQLNGSVLTLTVGTNYTSCIADLVGGEEKDKKDFSWTTNDSKVAIVYGQNEVGKIRALKAGTTYITVSHPKSTYSAQLLVVCDEPNTSDCVISVPSQIINMKPTDSSQLITANLINGTTTDKYNFKWSLDVYDVIDIQYAGNECTITPKQTGSATITISHPKAAYDCQVIVTVQQYNTFAFPSESMTITQGDVKFLTMQVPNTNVATHIEYSVENSSICGITGTKTTSQISAVGSGTTTVTAKLVASSTGVKQAEAQMMIYVKEKDINGVYITSTSTITTVNKGKSQTLSANLTGMGVVTSDQYNLKWTSGDTDIIQVTGVNTEGYVTGQSIYVTALKPGEAVITCSHPKAASTLQFYVVVPGTKEKVITLNKSYVTMLKGSSGIQLKAKIDNAESQADYYDIEWTCDGSNGEEICRIMGSGQNVTIYPLKPGEATVMAQLPNSSIVAKCTVIVEAGKSFAFETTAKHVQPCHTKKIKYTVSPPDAILTWTLSSTLDDIFEYTDKGCDENGNGEVWITGIKEGSGVLTCVTDGSAKGTLNVRVSWDYQLDVSTSLMTIQPNETYEIDFKINPVEAELHVDSAQLGKLFNYELLNNNDGTGKIVIHPIGESENEFTIGVTATNPDCYNEQVGSRLITARICYDNIHLKVLEETKNKVGAYSFYNEEAQTLNIGDGETIALKFDIAEENANAEVESVEYEQVTSTNILAPEIKSSISDSYKILSLRHPTDFTEYEYYINKAYKPVYNGVPIDDWKSAFWWSYSWQGGAAGVERACYSLVSRYSNNADYCVEKLGLGWESIWAATGGNNHVSVTTDIQSFGFTQGNTYTLEENPDEQGKVYKIKEFESIPWYFRPAYNAGGKWFTAVGTYSPSGGSTTTKEYSTKQNCNWGCRLLTNHVDATYRLSTDVRINQGVEVVGKIVVTIKHHGRTQKEKIVIPVVLEVRSCPCTYTPPVVDSE